MVKNGQFWKRKKLKIEVSDDAKKFNGDEN